MAWLNCDFHIHSCLSPCGDDDMTPNNIVNMAMLNGLDLIALTDHNTCGNCRATMAVGDANGVIVIPGMELTTSEEIHVTVIFPDIEKAEAFGAFVAEHRMPIANRPDIYGNQFFMDSEDNVVGEEEQLLILATDINLYDVVGFAGEYGGLATLAHIDRHSNGVLGVLGGIDRDMGFFRAEVTPHASEEDYKAKYPFLNFVKSSDAHDLLTIAEAGNCTVLDCPERSREAVFKLLSNYGYSESWPPK